MLNYPISRLLHLCHLIRILRSLLFLLVQGLNQVGRSHSNSNNNNLTLSGNLMVQIHKVKTRETLLVPLKLNQQETVVEMGPSIPQLLQWRLLNALWVIYE